MNPRLSVVIIARRDSAMLSGALERLRLQTAAAELECIVVAESRAKVGRAIDALEGRLAYQLVEVGSLESEGAAKAAGIAAARAGLVAFMEDHSYLEAGWAEAMMRAHGEEEYAAVGPVVLNANPGSAASWGCFLVFYGTHMWPRPQEEIRQLAGNQSCYRREVLLGYGCRLPDMLQAECLLHAELLAKGHRLFQEPAARVSHLNFSRPRPALHEYYLASRVFAAERSAEWSIVRRCLYSAGCPLLLLIRPPRILEDARRARLGAGLLLRAFGPVMLILAAGAAGEMVGYALGSGRAKSGLLHFVRERDAEFTASDMEAVDSA